MSRTPRSAAITPTAAPTDGTADEAPAAPATTSVTVLLPADLARRLKMHSLSTDSAPALVIASLILEHLPEYTIKPVA